MKTLKRLLASAFALAFIAACSGGPTGTGGGGGGGTTYALTVMEPTPGATYCQGEPIPAPDRLAGEIALNPPLGDFIQRWYISGGPYSAALMGIERNFGVPGEPLVFKWDGGPMHREMVKPPVGAYTIMLKVYKFEGSSTPGPLLAETDPISISVIECG